MTGASRFGDGSDRDGGAVFQDARGRIVDRESDAFNDAEHVGAHVRGEPWQIEARDAAFAEQWDRKRAEAQAEAVERARVLEVLAAHSRSEFPELEQEKQAPAVPEESLADVAARIYGDRPGELDEVAQRVTGGATSGELDQIAERIYRR